MDITATVDSITDVRVEYVAGNSYSGTVRLKIDGAPAIRDLAFEFPFENQPSLEDGVKQALSQLGFFADALKEAARLAGQSGWIR